MIHFFFSERTNVTWLVLFRIKDELPRAFGRFLLRTAPPSTRISLTKRFCAALDPSHAFNIALFKSFLRGIAADFGVKERSRSASSALFPFKSRATDRTLRG